MHGATVKIATVKIDSHLVCEQCTEVLQAFVRTINYLSGHCCQNHPINHKNFNINDI